MSVIILPVDGVAEGAQNTRNAWSAFWANGTTRNLGSQSGMVAGAMSNIAASKTTWAVGVGTYVIDPAVTLIQSPYIIAITAAVTGTMTAAHATLTRKDILYLTANDDPIDSSGLKSGTVTYDTGTAASTPAADSPPTGSLLLATITVPSAANGGVPVVVFNNQFVVATGGLLPIGSASQRDALIVSPYDGYPIYRLDINATQVYNGTGWDTWYPSYALTTAYGSGVPASGNAYNTAKPVYEATVLGDAISDSNGLLTISTTVLGASSLLGAFPVPTLGSVSGAVDCRLVFRPAETTVSSVVIQARAIGSSAGLGNSHIAFAVLIKYQV